MCYCAFKYNNTICVSSCREATLKVFGSFFKKNIFPYKLTNR